MSLVFTASTTRTLLSAVAPFATLPFGFITLPVVEPPRAPRPRTVSTPAPRTHVPPPPPWEDIELRPMGAPRGRMYPDEGYADDSTAPCTLADATASGFAARPSAPLPRTRTRSTMSKLTSLARRDAPPGSARGDQGPRLCDAVKTARTALVSRTRRVLNSVFPALGAQNRAGAGYVRLRGRN